MLGGFAEGEACAQAPGYTCEERRVATKGTAGAKAPGGKSRSPPLRFGQAKGRGLS